MSGEYPAALRRRALNALGWARRACDEGDYDRCALQAEYSVQLYLKSLIYCVASEEARGCDVRELFGVIISLLFEQGARDVAEELSGYVRRHRTELAELSDAHTRAVHGLTGYGGAEAKLLLRIAQELVEVAQGLRDEIL